MPTSADAMMPGFVAHVVKQPPDGARPCHLGYLLQAGLPHPLGRGRVVHQLAQRHRERFRPRRADFAVDVVNDQLGRSAAVGAGHDGLARCKRFDSDEPIVFVVGRKTDGAAVREVLEHLAVVDAPDQRHARRQALRHDRVLERLLLFPFAGDHAADAGRLRIAPAPRSAATAASAARAATRQKYNRRSRRIDTARCGGGG